MFEKGQKFHVKNAEYFITIEGSMNGSQGIHRKYPSENHYNIDVNGSKSFMSESQLMQLLKSHKDQEEKPKIIETKKEEIEFVDKMPKIEMPDDKIIEQRIVKPEKKGGIFRWKNK